MLNAIKIRIYPNKDQVEKLERAFGCARWFWNNCLAETQKQYKETGKGLGRFDMNKRYVELKKEHEWLSEPYSQIFQSTSLNLSRAFINFFEKRAKFPKFKSKHHAQKIQYPQNVKVVEGAQIHLPKVGGVKAVVHRKVVGKIKTVTVSKTPTGKYYASILVEDDLQPPSISYEGKTLGIDMGLTNLAITSDGSKFNNPKHIAKAQKNLKRKQQKLSRKIKGGNSRDKARVLVAKVHEKIANKRKDNLHKISRRLVNENQVIAVEDLNVSGMVKNPCLAKAINDAGWGAFTSMLKYKAEREGKGYIEINRFYPSSKACSECGIVCDKLPLNIRVWTCSNCSATHDRDVNAAKNIALEAQREIAVGITGTASGGNVRRGRGRTSSVRAVADEARSSAL